MKKKLTLTIKETVLAEAKRKLRRRHQSVSQAVETFLASMPDSTSFVEKWKGAFDVPQANGDARLEYLIQKHLKS